MTLSSKFSSPALSLALPLVLAGVSLQSCAPAATQEQTRSDVESFSNRPQSYDQFVAIVQLKSPPLLKDVKKVDGKPVIDEALKQKITAEQEKFIKQVKAIHPSIKIIASYKLVLNAVAIAAPIELKDKFSGLANVSYVESSANFVRPEPVSVKTSLLNDVLSGTNLENLNAANSTTWIGAQRVQNELTTLDKLTGKRIPVTGKGVTVGVIDTGVDYTHSMFGGAGTVEAYKAVNPDAVAPGQFPTAKVIGGIDLVGTTYDSGSPIFENHIPKPDANPIDEAGHGSHVAGTIAGRGDGVETYTGVAPDASILAIKVFGKEGSTGDAVIISALEYAANPSGDLSAKDRLDVVNLSLGSEYGTPHLLYTEAMKNLSQGGTVTVCSAGNSGDVGYIVGAPSTTPEVISVAATIDNMPHNWKFNAVNFSVPGKPEILAEAIEASITKPIAEAGDVVGKLVHIGLASVDLTEEQKAAVKGNVALIDRGAAPFAAKIKRAAEAGAIGVVVANNVDGDPFTMGGSEEKFEIPAIMITKALGETLKAAGESAVIDFLTDKKIEKPELIDTLTSFSSRGPRSLDALIKPEVSAPGSDIISAAFGQGNKGVKFSGTSMAAPHVAGVSALLRQIYSREDAQIIKSFVVNNSKTITDQNKAVYPVSQMGAGRVQAFEAATSKLAFFPQAMSLGVVDAGRTRTIKQTLSIDNLSQNSRVLNIAYETKAGLSIQGDSQVTVQGNGRATLDLKFTVKAPAEDKNLATELDGMIKVTVVDESGTVRNLQIPVLAIAKKSSSISVSDTTANASQAIVHFRNAGKTAGDAYIFNLLGTDEKGPQGRRNIYKQTSCDMESVGYRVVTKKVEDKEVQMLQFAVKLQKPLTTWQLCDVSVLIDQNNDGVAEQELVGTYLQTLSGSAADNKSFGSFLTDAAKMRDLRKKFETEFPASGTLQNNYTEAVIDAQDYIATQNSTVAILSADLSKLSTTPNGFIRFKIGTLANVEANGQTDDFLGKKDGDWSLVSLNQIPFTGMPEVLTLDAQHVVSATLKKGSSKGPLVVYYPQNIGGTEKSSSQKQSEIIKKP